jgi:hypothetical protein
MATLTWMVQCSVWHRSCNLFNMGGNCVKEGPATYKISSFSCPGTFQRLTRMSPIASSDDKGSESNALTRSDHSSNLHTILWSRQGYGRMNKNNKYHTPRIFTGLSAVADRSSYASDRMPSHKVGVSSGRGNPEFPVASWTRGRIFVILWSNVNASCL